MLENKFLDSSESIKYDGKQETWEKVYEKVYNNNLPKEEKFIRNGRYQKYGEFSYKEKKSQCMYFSGDIIFNFFDDAPKKRGKRRLYTEMMKLLEIYEKKKEYENREEIAYIMDMLEKCNQRTECKVNVSIMPSTGGLQFVKQAVGRDRPDTFIWCLNEHYNGSSILFNHCAASYIDELKSFLALFDSVFEYCDCIYNISAGLTSRLIESGAKPIDSPQRIKEYVILANEFWHERIDKFQQLKIDTPKGK